MSPLRPREHELSVNGERRRVEADPGTPLLWILRDALDLTGTKYGCGIARCGACKVLLDGEAVASCVTTLSEAAGRSVVTIEGLSEKGDHPVQRAWLAERVPQCGYCQAGQIIAAVDLLARTPRPSEAEIEAGMAGNLCRCGTHVRILRAVNRAAATPA